MSSWNQDKPGKEAELETARYYVMSGVHVRKLTENIIRSWDMNKAKMLLKKKTELSKLDWDHTVADGATEEESVGKSGEIDMYLQGAVWEQQKYTKWWKSQRVH